MKYTELLKKFNGDEKTIPYLDLLTTDEWYSKRQVILKRDNNTCTQCTISPIKGLTGYGLQGYVNDTVVIYGDYKSVILPNIIVDTKGIYLEVHHRYYILNKLPLEIDDNGLVTLCRRCHENIHKTTKIIF